MREYKFGGKRVDNGELVYGSYFHNGVKHYIITIDDNSSNDEDDFTLNEVDPETVGQYTGQKAIGKEVYEGDIFDDDDGGYLVVKFVEDEAAFMFVHYNYRMWRNEGGGEEFGSRLEKLDTYFMNEWTIENMEVIGNIHDNPDLLGGEANA